MKIRKMSKKKTETMIARLEAGEFSTDMCADMGLPFEFFLRYCQITDLARETFNYVLREYLKKQIAKGATK